MFYKNNVFYVNYYSLMNLSKIKLQISTKISPKNFNNPEIEINKLLSLYLFKYTYKLLGIPLCYQIVGIYPIGNLILDNSCVFLTTVVEYDVLKIKIGDYLTSEEGYYFKIFSVIIDNDNNYTGRFKVIDINNTEEDFTYIIGEKV